MTPYGGLRLCGEGLMEFYGGVVLDIVIFIYNAEAACDSFLEVTQGDGGGSVPDIGTIPPHSQLVIPFSRWLWQTAARERCFVFSQLLGLPRVQTCVMGCRLRLGSFDPCFALAL